MSKNDGGPAFPYPASMNSRPESCNGQSLRDDFAGRALTGLMASAEEHFAGNGKSEEALDEWSRALHRRWARFCYRMADAMLEAREE